MNDLLTQNEGGRSEVDGLLRDYFQAEMPHPWPAFRSAGSTRPRQVVSLWSRYAGRLALAACVALLAGGYLTLSGYFPQQQDRHGVEVQHNIGMKERGKSKMPALKQTESSNDADILQPMGVQSSGKK